MDLDPTPAAPVVPTWAQVTFEMVTQGQGFMTPYVAGVEQAAVLPALSPPALIDKLMPFEPARWCCVLQRRRVVPGAAAAPALRYFVRLCEKTAAAPSGVPLFKAETVLPDGGVRVVQGFPDLAAFDILALEWVVRSHPGPAAPLAAPPLGAPLTEGPVAVTVDGGTGAAAAPVAPALSTLATPLTAFTVSSLDAILEELGYGPQHPDRKIVVDTVRLAELFESSSPTLLFVRKDGMVGASGAYFMSLSYKQLLQPVLWFFVSQDVPAASAALWKGLGLDELNRQEEGKTYLKQVERLMVDAMTAQTVAAARGEHSFANLRYEFQFGLLKTFIKQGLDLLEKLKHLRAVVRGQGAQSAAAKVDAEQPPSIQQRDEQLRKQQAADQTNLTVATAAGSRRQRDDFQPVPPAAAAAGKTAGNGGAKPQTGRRR